MAVPEASATPAGDDMTATMHANMHANMHAAVASVTTNVTTTVASAVTTATVATTTVPAMCLGRHVGCGHHQTSGAGSRDAIHSGQGPKGQ
jgi:hypothetical protein